MILADLLREKGSDVKRIDPSATLDDAVQSLVEHNIGSLVVCRQGQSCDEPGLLGIVTERDILRACAVRRGPLDALVVNDYMTTEVITGTPQDEIEEIMGVMTERRIRHLPVLEGGKLLGIISIGDIVKAQHQQMALENHYLKSYIHG
jgi:CBS domain-containing protein